MAEKEFFMVWGTGKSSPTKMHESFCLAESEAQRLAIAENRSFFILRSVAEVSPVRLTETKTLSPASPFVSLASLLSVNEQS